MSRSTAMANRLGGLDALLIALLVAVLGAHLALTFDRGLPPYEDAAILMRYARHLAAGHGIVWNVGEAPVDGATDMGFLVVVAALARFGLTVEQATQGVGLAAHALTVVLLYAGARRLHGAPRWAAFLSAGFLALGPGIRYVEAGFGTPLFALFTTTTWWLATYLFRGGAARGASSGFAVSALLMGLTRPEGVFLSAFVLLGLVLARGARACRRTIGAYVAVHATLGAAYFAWHWAHFGHPLPNTFYVKGGGLWWAHLATSPRQVADLAAPFVPLLILALLAEAVVPRGGGPEAARAKRDATRELVFLFTPIVGYLALSVLHGGLMDYLHRFAYCLLPIVLLSWPPLLRRLADLGGVPPPERRSGRQRALLRVAVLLFAAGALGRQLTTYRASGMRWWGTWDVGHLLADYPRDWTMAVTNAGHLPYASGWNAIDAWGLNDPEIARGGLTVELLERRRPELIQLDAGFSPLTPERFGDTRWSRAVRVLMRFAEANGYALAAAFGPTPEKCHWYWVRGDLPERDELVERLRGVEYHLGGSARRCFDWSRFERVGDSR